MDFFQGAMCLTTFIMILTMGSFLNMVRAQNRRIQRIEVVLMELHYDFCKRTEASLSKKDVLTERELVALIKAKMIIARFESEIQKTPQ